MGLDTSHDCWHGAYSAFRRFRNAIAEAAGYPMERDGQSGLPDYVLPWDELADENYMGDWDRVPGDDPLIVFLAHSDCDGVIHPEHGAHIAKRLREIAAKLPDDGEGHIFSYRGAALRFAAGLEEAAENGEDVVFA